MNISVQIPGIEEFVVRQVNEHLTAILDRVTQSADCRLCFVNKAKAAEILGTAIFLRAGERDGKLTPISLGGSAGTLYSVEQLQELSRWITQKAKTGSLPDHYIISNSKKTADEKEVHSHHNDGGSPKNIRTNRRSVPRPTGQPSQGS